MKATEFDVGPLSWVKSEIDLALKRADQALQEFSGGLPGGGDPTQLKFCRTHLHQVQGALTIVGLDGVTQLAEAAEALLERIEQGEQAPDEATLTLARRALSAIGHYLDELLNGEPNQPLRLLSVYRDVQTARGLNRVAASDLFFPDLSARPPRRTAGAADLPHSEFLRLVRQARARFQRGFLAWLRQPEERGGIREMLAAVRQIETTQEASSTRAFWWVARGLLTALIDGSLPADTNVKQLCARIDLQIRRLIEGSKNVAERLMRDALYFVATAPSSSDDVRQVQHSYRLESLIPSSETAPPPPAETVRRRLRELIAVTEEAWNKYCAGTQQALPQFRDNAATLAAAVDELGHTDFRRLTQAISAAAQWLAEDATRHSDTLAMEIATAILLAQNAQANFQRLGSDFAHQVDVTVARIHGCLAGQPPQPGSEIPLLDEMSRQAQEKLLISQVAKEIQSNLAQIEQVLDAFFRDPDKRADLAALDTPLRQISGALTIMRQDGAVAALRHCSDAVQRFADPAYAPQEADFEAVASQLSLLGFFVDALQHGGESTDDYDAFVRRVSAPAADETTSAEAEEPKATVEAEVEKQKQTTAALLEALIEQPHDQGLREEVRQNLSTLKKDADLVADTKLGEQTGAMLDALDAGESSPQIDQVMATLKPQAAIAPPPSAATLQLAQASTEEIDAELLAIFLEEAREVLATIDDSLGGLKAQPHNVELLTSVRRSFHTLKGSGRMVGLKEVGETAWAIEQTLNLWLRQELPVETPLFALLDQAYALFSEWVAALESPGHPAPDPSAVIACAEALRNGSEAGDAPLPGERAQATPPEPIPSEALSVAAEAEVETEAATETAPETASEPEPPTQPPADADERPSAEIITLDFHTARPATPPDADPTATPEFTATADEGIESIELIELPEAATDAELDFALELERENAPPQDSPADEPEPAAAAPEWPADDTRDASQQRISLSPVLFDIFSEEAGVHLSTLQRELAVLERDENAPTPHEMYRAAHTLAGISATVGITPVNHLGHALEHALLRRDHSAHPGSLEALGVIRQAVGEVELMLSAIAQHYTPSEPQLLIATLDDLYPVTTVPVPAPSALPPAALSPEHPADEALEPAPVLAPTPDAEAVTPATAALQAGLPLLADDIDEQLLPIFLEEAVDLNQSISAQLRAWHAAPDNAEPVRTLARLLHTLKGSARMAGAMRLGEMTHAIESRVDELSRQENVAPAAIDEIDAAFDTVLQAVERLQRGETAPVEPPPQAVAPAPVENVPAVPVAAAEPSPAATVAAPAERRHDRSRLAEVEGESDAAVQRASLRVRADLIDRLVNDAGELSIARARIEGEMRGLKESLLDLTENVIRLRRQLREIEIQAETQMQSRTAQSEDKHTAFDPLEFDRFTRFQELTRMMAESVNDVATVQQSLLKNLDDANAAIVAQARLNRELQQELMSVRMVPFGSLADRLYRIVRQTSKELDKRANLEIRGSQVELDRSVLDKIAAPLEHLLRNAIAHGLEPLETRSTLGKRDIGEISLGLKQEGNEIILSLSDDGAGLDFERIRARAIEHGLMAANEELEASQLANFIFTPGFSTASEVSQISGRGIGMDVVKTEIGSLGGRIEIFSTPGQGTEFRLYIPLTLAVTQSLLVRAGNRRYAIPSSMIEQVLDLKESALARIRDAGLAEWMGHHYPFNYLPHLLGDTQALPEQHRQYWTLLLRSGARRIAVQVDELLGNQEIVVKNIGPQLARVIGIDGATVLGDGQVVLILNPVALSSRAPVAEFVTPVPTTPELSGEAAVTANLPTVMVVDDSLTVRKITGRLLAREGYQVLLAKDGTDALEQLHDILPDVMLVDIEMPRMDGYDLTRNLRADPRLKDIPIIMITSRTADKHRDYAFELGVNHYLGKPYQEDELLALIADYVRARRHA